MQVLQMCHTRGLVIELFKMLAWGSWQDVGMGLVVGRRFEYRVYHGSECVNFFMAGVAGWICKQDR